MLNIKKMVLFLIVGVFLIGMIDVVFGIQYEKSKVGYTANVTGITRKGAVEWSSYNMVTQTKVTTQYFGESIYLRNASDGLYTGYVINITIFNLNTTHSSGNISKVNITLPAGLNFTGLTNGTNANLISTAGNINFTYDVTKRELVWMAESSATSLIVNKTGITNSSFWFNVTSLPSSDGLVNITVVVSPNNTAFNSVYNTYYIISERLYLDGTIPTFANATTNSTTTLNVTFSENMNVTTVETHSINITFTNRSGLAESVAVTATESQTNGGNDSMASFTIGKIQANETPTVWLNMSAITRITDLAGYEIASNTSVTASDGAPPTFKSGTIDLSSYPATLTLVWDEPMDTFGSYISNNIVILMANNTQTNISVQNLQTDVTVGAGVNTTIIKLNFTDQSNVTRLRTGVNLTLYPWFFNDTAGNKMSSKPEKQLLTFTNDTTRPTIVNYSYTHRAEGRSDLLLGFAEAIDMPSVTTTQIKLAYDSNHNASVRLTKGNLSDSSFSNSYVIPNATFTNVQTGNRFYKTLNLTFNSTKTDFIAAWDRKKTTKTIYLSFENNSMYDLMNNPVNAVVNTSGNEITEDAANNAWTTDTTVPTVLTATISDVNVTGPGWHRITVWFSENMTNTTFTVTTLPNFIRKDSTAMHSTTTPVFNLTFIEGTSTWEGYYNFTQTDTNGEWNISVSTSSTDLSGNAITNSTTDLEFIYDSEPPYIIYAYYLENGTSVGSKPKTPYNGTLGGNQSTGNKSGDTLILAFNEPLQPMVSVNISQNNLTFRDGVFCDVNCTISIASNKVTITTYKTPTLNLRGEWVDVYNASSIQAINNRDLTKNSSTWYIRDKADNFARARNNVSNDPNTVIADYGVKVTSNAAMTISFPTCVNTGNMSDYLSSTASDYTFAKYYNTATWGEDLVTSLVPLVGYRFTSNTATVFTYSHSQWGNLSDNMLRIYLNNKTECGPPGPTLTIGDGYNFLAPEGVWTTQSTWGYAKKNKGDALDPDAWLTSLNSGGDTGKVTDVSLILGNYTGESYSDDGIIGGDWDNGVYIYPYTGWWVATRGSPSTTYTFYGSGRY